jgi:hypothetical protein
MYLLGVSDSTKQALLHLTDHVSDLPSQQCIMELQILAQIFSDEEKLKKILMENSAEEALTQLRTNEEFLEISLKFDQFLRYFGHRGNIEFELYAKDWAQDPVIVLQMIKNYFQLSETWKPSEKSVEELTASLSDSVKSSINKLTPTQQKIFRHAVWQLRQGVQFLDKSRNMLVKCMVLTFSLISIELF